MDPHSFDRLIAAAGRRPSRRTALRLLAAGLLSALWPARETRADHSDVDGDQLWDEDEVNVYGTRPDVADTDGDGASDGLEIWNRDQGLGGNDDPLVNENAAPPPADPAPPAATCTGFGGPCAAHSSCCGYEGSGVLCCFDANGAGTCTDVSVRGFTCPDPGVPDTGCAVGLTNCGGFCTDLSTDHGNCGACGNRCSQVCGPDCNCVAGTCTRYCGGGLTNCGNVCVDLLNDGTNCGGCGIVCIYAGVVVACQGGACPA